jgi:signal transduction histidine kinase/ligand-binding sensor domain-containing protein/DNA-binding response OmpR family regulator
MLLILIVMSITPPRLHAQFDQPRFKHLTVDNGLSQNAVFAIVQDRKGFMWIGTKDGLNRYDGYSFTVYRHDPFDTTSISSNHVTALYEDRRGYLWIGTVDGGLNRYVPDTGTFQRFTDISVDTDDDIHYAVSAITEDVNSNIWIGTTGNGVIKYTYGDGEHSMDGAFRRYVHQPGVNGSLSDNTVSALYADSKGNVWVGTQKRLNKLIVTDTDDVFRPYAVFVKHPDAPVTHQDSSISAITQAADGYLWLGTTSGLVRFDGSDGSYDVFPHRYEVYRYGWGRIVGIVEGRFGRLWLATPGELMQFDPESESYTYYRYDPFDRYGISYNGISSIYRDRTDILWIGTPGYGLNLLDHKIRRFRIFQPPGDSSSRVSGFSVRSILEDRNGDVWISTDVLQRWKRSTDELISYETDPNLPYEFGNTGPWAMLQTRRGDALYFVSHAGLYRLELETGRIDSYIYDGSDPSGLPQKEVFAIFEDRDGTIWIATKNYLSRLVDAETGSFRHYQYSRRITDELVRPQIFQDEQGRIWLGTDDGLYLFDPVTESFRIYRNDPVQATSLSINGIKSICPDPDEPGRYLWLGTDGGGLNHFDMEHEIFRHFTEKDGLPNNVVYGILPDERGDLWLSTNRGLSRFNRETETFKNYDIHDGLQSNEFNTGAFFKSKSGELFFGGINGINYFFPATIADNPYPPPTAITGLKILNRSVSHTDDNSILSKPITETEVITITSRQDIITFEFAALDYSAPEKNQYAYKLEGFNKEWIYSGTNRSATFTNLRPGNYTFRVRGSNNDGLWSEHEASVILIISPPFWQTWWAYVLYLLAGILLLFAFRKYEMNRIALKNQLRLEQVNREKMNDLDSLKSRFFANISHELRTPLTLILGPAEQLNDELEDERHRHKSRLIHSNAQRLLRLINQLLDIARLESGSMKLHAGLYNAVPFVRGITMSFSGYAERKRIDLRFSSSEERIALYFDRDKAEKIFINILSNAIKFTPTGGSVSVELSIENLESGACANISIRDTGIGIPTDQLPYVFDRFYQVGGASSHEHEGTGIGLALVKELVELHRGSVTVTSELGKGSIFTVSLPLGKSHLSTDEIDGPDEDRLEVLKDTGSNGEFIDNIDEQHDTVHDVHQNDGKTLILLVEDNTDLRTYIKDKFTNGYRILEATNGIEGFSIASEIIPDLIISDVMMPKMNGYEFCRKVKNDQRTSHIPVILLTAKAEERDKFTGLKTGADDYLIKPFNSEELLLRVENLCESRRRLREKYSTHAEMKPTDVAVTPLDKKFLEHILSVVKAHIGDLHFSVEILAENVNMSQSQVHRKLKALTNLSANQFIRSIRMQRALELLKQNAGNVAEIAYMVGYNDPGYFTRTFKNFFEYLPSDVKRE